MRRADTVMLNRSLYRFDHRFTDYLAAAEGYAEVQSDQAGKNTFTYSAAIVKNVKTTATMHSMH